MSNRVNNNVKSHVSDRYSYQPLPLYDDQYQDCFHFEKRSAVKYKMDLNLYCIKKPTQTFFMRVTNPNLMAWNIEQGDMLVIEEDGQPKLGDLVVVEQHESLQLYEFFSAQPNQFVFFSLDSHYGNLQLTSLQDLEIRGVVTNTIHQLRGKKAAA